MRFLKGTTFIIASLLAFTPQVEANDLSLIAASWQIFMSDCAQVMDNPQAYVSTLPASNADGSLTRTVSPDGKAITINLRKGQGYIEAFVDTLSDREVRHCSYYAELSSSWDTAAISQQYVDWLRQNPTIEVIGGYSPIYGYDHYRHAVLGMWPVYDLEVQTNIHENEFQLLMTRTVN